MNRFFLLLGGLCLSAWASLHAAPLKEVPFEFKDGVIWIKIQTPGSASALNFVLDSGAGVSVLNLSTSRQLGTRLGAAQSVQGVGGTCLGYRVREFQARLAEMPLPGSMLVLDLDGVSASAHQRIDGLLGLDFLRAHILQIDFKNQKLSFLEGSPVAGTGMAVLPMVRRNDAMCVGVSLAGQASEWMRVDTGCRSGLLWVLSEARAGKLGPAITATRSPLQIETCVQLGTLRLEGVRTGIRRQTLFAGESGLLGNGLLSRYTVTLDCVHGRLFLQPPVPPR